MKHRLNKKLGQNFLRDENILRMEVATAEVKNKKVLEIGAGDGRLTEKILDAEPKSIIAIEKDKRFAAILREKFLCAENVWIIEGDFLLQDFKGEKIDVIIGNIPYYISSQIIFTLPKMQFERAYFIVQKEFAQKMVAKPNDSNYGRLSVTSQIYFHVSYLRTISKSVFMPVPKVDSALIELRKTGAVPTEFDENVIRYLFQHKNQGVKKSLTHSKAFSEEQLGRLGNYSKKKVRTLSKEDCWEIIGLLKEKEG